MHLTSSYKPYLTLHTIPHLTHLTSPYTPYLTLHTLPHHMHFTSPYTPHLTLHTSPHITHLTSPHLTHLASLHLTQLTSPNKPHLTLPPRKNDILCYILECSLNCAQSFLTTKIPNSVSIFLCTVLLSFVKQQYALPFLAPGIHFQCWQEMKWAKCLISPG